MARQRQEQKIQLVLEAQVAKEAQERMAQQLAEAPKIAQSIVMTLQQYKERLAHLTPKMGQQEALLIAQ